MQGSSSLVVILALTAAVADAQPLYYRPVDIGSLKGMATYATALNEQGQVVGYSFVRPALPHRGSLAHAFLYQNGTITDLFPLNDIGYSVATAINESSEVAGYRRWDDMAPSEPFVWEATAWPLILNPFGAVPVATGAANGINDGGDIVGGATTQASSGRAFLLARPWTTVAATDLTPSLPAPYDASNAVAVNNVGHVAGNLGTSTLYPNNVDATDSFYSDGRSLTLLDELVPGRSFQPQAMNEADEVVGYDGGSTPVQAFLYAGGSMHPLGTLAEGGLSLAYGINGDGDVVGSATDSNGSPRAVLWKHGTLHDLNGSIPASFGVVLTEARAINDLGQIVAWGYLASQPSGEPTHSFLLTFSPSDAIAGLIDFITGLGLPHGIENSLTQKLRNALVALQSGDTQSACDLLGAFIHELEAQSGKKIDAGDATRAIEDASQVRMALGCS